MSVLDHFNGQLSELTITKNGGLSVQFYDYLLTVINCEKKTILIPCIDVPAAPLSDDATCSSMRVVVAAVLSTTSLQFACHADPLDAFVMIRGAVLSGCYANLRSLSITSGSMCEYQTLVDIRDHCSNLQRLHVSIVYSTISTPCYVLEQFLRQWGS